MNTPTPGWYEDPGGSGGLRYWDGVAWTQALQPHPAAAHQPHPAAAHQPHPAAAHQPVPDPARRGARPWLIGGATVLVVAVAVIAVLASTFQRGAPTPLAAAEQLVEAVNSGDALGLLLVLPPDEIDAFRGLVDHFPQDLDDGDAGEPLVGARFEVEYGEETYLTDGVASLPIERITAEIIESGWFSEDARLEVGERDVLDLRNEPNTSVIAVERRGRWFISPLGTGLEFASRDAGRGGARPAVPRAGAASPRDAADRLIQIQTWTDPAALLDLLDPEEFQVLDHYRHLLTQPDQGRNPLLDQDVTVRVESDVQGEVVEISRVAFSDPWSTVTFDLTTLCIEEDGFRECLLDEFSTDPADPDAVPWATPVIRALFEPQPATLRLGTVTRDQRTFISMQGTIEESILPVLERMGPHNLVGPVRGDLSPEAVEVDPVPGTVVDLPLHDNWNALRFTEPAELRVCPADPSPGTEWRVDGAVVRSDAIYDLNMGSDGAVGAVVGVQAGYDVDVVGVRLAWANEPC